MTDHTNTYPDLVNVEDWLNASGYTGEAGACHQAMSLIRSQEKRIADLKAEISILRGALKPFAEKADDVLKNLHGGHVNYIPELISVTLGDLRAARAALEKKDAQQP